MPSIPARLRELCLLLACGLGCGGGSLSAVSCHAEEPGDEPGDGEAAAAEAEAPKKNHLASETSPYLLQHVDNPVDWYPWGEEAFAKAEREEKVIFLSVGYSSCHWCHVMQHETFEDQEIARFLNEHYVCIKVDREERPDVDAIYMTAVQLITQRGGWPMSVFLTPDGKPFFGGTYFPARDGDRFEDSTGFLTIVTKIQEIWKERRDDVKESAEQIAKLIKEQLDARPPEALEPVGAKNLTAAVEALDEQYDPKYGGFGYGLDPQQPKFPEPAKLNFLIDAVDRTGDEKAKAMLVDTLEHMAGGGIRDHVGGGFHRYSVDRYWEIPHFEKMLYDNAQLASAYAHGHRLTGRQDFRRVAEELIAFVLREMTDEGGGFYAALDADSEHEEGKFYRWTKEELQRLLSEEDLKLFAEVYGVDGEPNFEEKFYVPLLAAPKAKAAGDLGMSEADLEGKLEPMRRKLLAARRDRQRPLTDTKILTGWNGLMIRGLADAGRMLEKREYVEAAARAAEFVLSKLRTEDGRLLRTYGGGEAKLNAYLDDYAFLVDGLIALHLATEDEKWLTAADELTKKQIELFWDDEHGGFYFTSGDHESLIARGKDPTDGAIPAGSSVSAENLVYLGRQRDNADYLAKARATIRSASGLLARYPAAAPRLLVAVGMLDDDEQDE